MGDRTAWRERAERRQARRAAVYEQYEPGRYATRRNRRRLAVLGGVLMLLPWADALVSWLIAPSDTAVIVNFAVLVVLVAAGLPLFGRLLLITRGTTALDERYLDERQVTQRLRAFTAAHRGTSIVVIALVALLTVATGSDDKHIPTAANFLLMFALLLTHLALPLLVATWRMPDPPPDDEDDDEDGAGDDEGPGL